MAVIYVLLVAHFVGDFICQSDWMAQNKSKNWYALAIHVAVYMLIVGVLAGALIGASYHIPIKNVQTWLVANFAAHFLQDAITSRINSRLWFLKMTPAVKGWRELDRMLDGTSTSTLETAYWVDDISTRHWFFVSIGFDQLLHYVTLFVTAGWWLR